MDEFRERFENGEDITPSEEVELPEGSGGAAPPDNGGGMQLPVGDFTPPEDGEMQIPERGEIGEMPGRGEMGEMPGRGEGREFTMPEEGGFGADRGGMMGSDDVYLIYTDDDPESYPNIFDNAKTDVSASDEERLIAALKALNEGGDVSDCVDVEAVSATSLLTTLSATSTATPAPWCTTIISMRRTAYSRCCPGTTTWPSAASCPARTRRAL